jgi:hypothetical protein
LHEKKRVEFLGSAKTCKSVRKGLKGKGIGQKNVGRLEGSKVGMLRRKRLRLDGVKLMGSSDDRR